MKKCLVCGRPLKDEESLKRNIGPTCWVLVLELAKEEKAKRKLRLRLKANTVSGQIDIFEIMGEGSE